jgi:hypothetical protein
MARRAALYLRSSKDRHDVSVDSQGRALRNHASQVGDMVVTEFSDRVESAKTDDRPGFQAMVAQVKNKNHEFDVVYCYDTSRFSRRQYDAQMYKHLLKSQGVELVFLKLPKTDTILDPIITVWNRHKEFVDGDSGHYRCHDRCGVRSIKKETLERAVLDEIFEAVFTRDMLLELQSEVRRLFSQTQPHQDHLASQLKKEVKNVDRQIGDLAGLLTEAKHRRPLIHRIDALEDERQELELRLSDLEKKDQTASNECAKLEFRTSSLRTAQTKK